MLIQGLPTARTRAHARVEALLNLAGVAIGGTAPTDIRVHDPHLYSRILAHGSLALTLAGIAIARLILRA